MDKKRSRIVALKLNPSLLRAFAAPSLSNSSHEGSSSGSPRNSSPVATGATPQVGSPAASEITPAATPGGKPGPKRGRTAVPPLPGKPGRKKQKLEPGASPAVTGSGANGSVPHVKLGPKANQGAINAQLRALDRTGRPCKRWAKTGFQLKSFTGVAWSLQCWSTPAGEKKAEASSPQSQASNAPSLGVLGPSQLVDVMQIS